MTTLTLAQIDELTAQVAQADAEVNALCHGSRRWTMTVPAEPDRDSDLVIGRALNGVEKLVEYAKERAAREACEALKPPEAYGVDLDRRDGYYLAWIWEGSTTVGRGKGITPTSAYLALAKALKGRAL